MKIENNNINEYLNDEETHNDFLSTEQIEKFVELYRKIQAHDKGKAEILFHKFYEKLSKSSKLKIRSYKYQTISYTIKCFEAEFEIDGIYFNAKAEKVEDKSEGYSNYEISINFSFPLSSSLCSHSMNLCKDIFSKHYGCIGKAILKMEDSQQNEEEKRCNNMYNECINMLI